MSEQNTNLEIALRYIEFFNKPQGSAEELAVFLSQQVHWQEMPNLFAPTGRTNGYDQMLTNFERGSQAVSPQHYEVGQAVAQGEWVVLQLNWSGTVIDALGPFAAGTKLTAQIASFLQFQEGRIITQLDYPCYPPLAKPNTSS